MNEELEFPRRCTCGNIIKYEANQLIGVCEECI